VEEEVEEEEEGCGAVHALAAAEPAAAFPFSNKLNPKPSTCSS